MGRGTGRAGGLTHAREPVSAEHVAPGPSRTFIQCRTWREEQPVLKRETREMLHKDMHVRVCIRGGISM